MRAAVLSAIGAIPTPSTIDEPSQVEGGVLVDMEAVSLNPLDVTVAMGAFALGHPEPPYVIGHEGVGRVGSRLVYVSGTGLGVTVDGLCAERRVVPESALIDLPDDADPVLAAAAGTAGLAGWMATTWRAGVRPGDRVVVRGATGAAGSIAVQAARAAGAASVVGVARPGPRLDALGQLVDATVPSDQEAMAQALTQAAGGPVDVMVDFMWGPGTVAGLASMAPGGRVVVAGGAAGPVAELPSGLIIGKRLEILGYTNFMLDRDQVRSCLLDLIERLRAGTLRSDVTAVSLDDVAVAWEGTRNSTGKYVVVIKEGSPA